MNLRSCIVRNQVGNAALAKLDALALAELVLCLLSGDAVDGEAALGVVDQTEVLASLLNGDDIHETGREGAVGADLAVDLDQALLDDGLDLVAVKRILEAVAEEDNQRQRVAELVRTGGGLGCVGTCDALAMLFFDESSAHLRAVQCSCGRRAYRTACPKASGWALKGASGASWVHGPF